MASCKLLAKKLHCSYKENKDSILQGKSSTKKYSTEFIDLMVQLYTCASNNERVLFCISIHSPDHVTKTTMPTAVGH